MARKACNPEYSIGEFQFPTEFDKKVAYEFFRRGKNYLFALAVDYPGLYNIPMCHYDKVRSEMKEMGFRHGYGRHNEKSIKLRYKIFFLGPRPRKMGCFGLTSPSNTRREDARGFKVFWLNTNGWLTS